MDDLEKLINGEPKEPQTPPAEDKQPKQPVVPPQESQEDEAIKKKNEQLQNLNKAITEAQGQLKTLRTQKKKSTPSDDELPTIDFTDPSAKAWDEHVKSTMAPALEQMEREKEEVRTFALKKFLEEKPALASNPDKVKEMMGMYERLHTASERNVEGVMMDLDRAYAATHSNELINAARQNRINQAEEDALMSDIAVSRGATQYAAPQSPTRKYSDEEKQILAKWGMTPAEHALMEKEQQEKK